MHSQTGAIIILTLASLMIIKIRSGAVTTESDQKDLKSSTVYFASICVSELIELGAKRKVIAPKKQNIAGEERAAVPSRRGGNDKDAAAIARNEKQNLANEARRRPPLAPASKGGCDRCAIIFAPALLFV